MYQRTSICKFYFDSKPVCDRENQRTCVDFLKEEVNVIWLNWSQSKYESGRKTPNKIPQEVYQQEGQETGDFHPCSASFPYL